MRSLLLIAAATLAFVVTPADAAAYFLLTAGPPQCFVHEASPDQQTVTVHYLTKSTTHTVMYQTVITVTDPLRQTVGEPHKMSAEQESTFTFQTQHTGRYDVCVALENADYPVKVELEISASNDMDYRDPAVPATDYLNALIDVMPLVGQSASELEYLSARQDRFEATVSSTYWRVVVCTLLNFVVGLGAAIWQILHLRKFFKEKKVV